MRRKSFYLSLIVLAFAVVAAPALAGHHKCGADVDIEKLKASVRWYPDHWNFGVRYKVEVEDYQQSRGFDLVLTFEDCGRPVVDDKGRQIQYVIPLDRPSKADKDELKFEGCQQFDLPAPAIARPDKLKIRGVVFQVEDRRPVDTKQKSVKFCH